MPPLPACKPHLSPEAYLAGERQSEWRHEHIDGQVYAMVGATDRHNLIVNALAVALTPAARRKPRFTGAPKAGCPRTTQQARRWRWTASRPNSASMRFIKMWSGARTPSPA